MSRLFQTDQIASRVQQWREDGEIVVFTNGCFDILHVGHLKTLTRAKSEGTKLIVGVNSDDSVRRLKGPTRPINDELDRAEILGGLRCVDAVVIFPEETPIELLGVIRPDVHVKGGDYRLEDLPEREVVEKHGGRIVIIDLVPGRSTTSLIKKTQNP
jgi:D-glycero-beta-D-manno-heptose 1-phosphate adenylyltransferase